MSLFESILHDKKYNSKFIFAHYQDFSTVVLLSSDWPPTAAKEGENERGPLRHARSLLSGWGEEHM